MGPALGRIWTSKGHSHAKISNGSGIRDPQIEMLRIEIMRTDRALLHKPRQAETTAVSCTDILHVYGFGSIRSLFQWGEIPPNSPPSGNSTRRMLACELLVCKTAVSEIYVHRDDTPWRWHVRACRHMRTDRRWAPGIVFDPAASDRPGVRPFYALTCCQFAGSTDSTPYNVMSCHVVSCHIRPYHVISYHIIWYDMVWLKHDLNSKRWNYHVHRKVPEQYWVKQS